MRRVGLTLPTLQLPFTQYSDIGIEVERWHRRAAGLTDNSKFILLSDTYAVFQNEDQNSRKTVDVLLTYEFL
jgi:hypothetical protein